MRVAGLTTLLPIVILLVGVVILVPWLLNDSGPVPEGTPTEPTGDEAKRWPRRRTREVAPPVAALPTGSVDGVIRAEPNPILPGAWVAISAPAVELRAPLSEDGRFSFPEVPAEVMLSLWLGPNSDGAHLYRLSSDLRLAAGEHRKLEFTVKMPSVVRGKVVDEEGEAMARVRIAVLPPHADWRESAVRVATSTDDKGYFYVGVSDIAAAGATRLVVDAVDRGFVLEEVLVDPSEMEMGQEIRVRLTMGLVIQGVALGPKDRPIAGATIHILEDYVGDLTVRRPVEGRVETDDRGRFRDDAYRPGVYRVFLDGRLDGSAVALVEEGVEAGEGEVELRFPGFGSLEVRFVDQVTGKSVTPSEASLEFIWGYTGEEERYLEWDDMARRGTTKYEKLPQGHYRVGAHHPDYESLFSDLVYVKAGESGRPVTFRLKPRD